MKLSHEDFPDLLSEPPRETGSFAVFIRGLTKFTAWLLVGLFFFGQIIGFG